MADRMAAARFALPALTGTALPDGSITGGRNWQAIAARLDQSARGLRRRMTRRSLFDRALADFVANELAGTAAEIRANLALEELAACQNAS